MWFEWLFKYPRQAFAQGELAFAGDFGALWWGAAAVLLILGIVFGRRVARFTIPRRASVHLLQIAAIAVLLTLIAEPVARGDPSRAGRKHDRGTGGLVREHGATRPDFQRRDAIGGCQRPNR